MVKYPDVTGRAAANIRIFYWFGGYQILILSRARFERLSILLGLIYAAVMFSAWYVSMGEASVIQIPCKEKGKLNITDENCNEVFPRTVVIYGIGSIQPEAGSGDATSGNL